MVIKLPFVVQGGEDEQQEVCDTAVDDGEEERQAGAGLGEGAGGGGRGDCAARRASGHPARQHRRDGRTVPRKGT